MQMAIWGAKVKPGEPYIHRYNSEAGRLCITQATLSYAHKLSRKKSIVLCDVGKRRPFPLCCLLPGKTESCPLNLELEENEAVVFSVLGPRSVYLTGYYPNLNHQHFSRFSNDTDSDGEDIEDTESDQSINFEEDDYDRDDSFIINSDSEVFPPPQPKMNSEGEQEIHLIPRFPLERKESGDNGCKHLKIKYQDGDSDGDKDASQQQIAVKECTTTSILDSKDGDKSLVSSLLKRKTVVKNAEVEVTKTAEEGENSEYDCSQAMCSKRNIDTIMRERKFDHHCGFFLPSKDDGNRSSGTGKKRKKLMVDQKGKIFEDWLDQDQNQAIDHNKIEIYKENEEQSQRKMIENMNVELIIVDELHEHLPKKDEKFSDCFVSGGSVKPKKNTDENKHTNTKGVERSLVLKIWNLIMFRNQM